MNRSMERLARHRERRRTQADLARLAQVGDYLLQDVGLDPGLAQADVSATIEKLMRRQ